MGTAGLNEKKNKKTRKTIHPEFSCLFRQTGVTSNAAEITATVIISRAITKKCLNVLRGEAVILIALLMQISKCE